jgi:hypothetical protein
MKDNPGPSEAPRRRDARRSFPANVAGKFALVLVAGFGLILLFRGCVVPAIRQEVGEIQQEHYQGSQP